MIIMVARWLLFRIFFFIYYRRIGVFLINYDQNGGQMAAAQNLITILQTNKKG